MRFFDKYTGFFRRIKAVYAVNNLLNLKHLKHNKSRYKKLGLSRPTWFSLSSKHFPNDVVHHESDDQDFNRDGIFVWKNFISEVEVDAINNQIQDAIDSGKIDFNFTQRKIVFAYEQVPVLKSIIKDDQLLAKLNSLMGEEVVPFQSINFVYGSEQKAHSDSVHMATYPSGGLTAAWLALDDIVDDNGPLFYYPGSHKLSYVTNEDMGNSTGWLLSKNPNASYESYVSKMIEEKGLKPKVLNLQKGDLIIWHANLLHGGMPHTNMDKTRRSMVAHYFAKDRICYHELSQRPAIIKEI